MKKISTTSLISKLFLTLLLLSSLKAGDSPASLIFEQGFIPASSSQDLCVAEILTPKEAKEITLKEAKDLYMRNAIFLDARNHFQYRKRTIKFALSVPANKFIEHRDALGKYINNEIVTFCSGIECGKSSALAKELINNGFEKVYVFKEGLPLWVKEKLPATSSFAKDEEDPYAISKEALENVDDRFTIIDVRSQEEFDQGHIKNSINIPITLTTKKFLEKLPKTKDIIFVCKSGSRAYEAIERVLESKGNLQDIFYFDGEINCDKRNRCNPLPFIY